MAVAETTAVRAASLLMLGLVAWSAACATAPAGRPPSVEEIQTIGALIPIVVGPIVGSRIGLPRRYVFTNAPRREPRDSSHDDGP